MKLTSTYLLFISVSVTLMVLSTAAVAEDIVLFTGSFSDMKGHLISQTDGKLKVSGGAATRQVFPFMQAGDTLLIDDVAIVQLK